MPAFGGAPRVRAWRIRRSAPKGKAGPAPEEEVMVLVDTSVWIRFLKNRAPYASALEDLLAGNEVAGHEFVLGELLVGEKNGRDQLLAQYEQLSYAKPVPHREVVLFTRERNLQGRGVGWVDLHLLASALLNRMPLWTADVRLLAIADELRIGYAPVVPRVN
jgi:predicted nucleic acid-binding protein